MGYKCFRYPTVTTLADGNLIIMSGSLKYLNFENLNETNNPTYEYYPRKQGTWPKHLDILEWAFPFNLYPQVFQLSNEKVLLFVSNRTNILNPEDDSVDTSIPQVNLDDKMPMLYPVSYF